MEGWLEAAYQALLESGVDAVKIQPLAKKLNLSRTSFYWFFKDREELLDALIAQWRDKNTGALIGRAQADAASITEAMLNVFDCWVDKKLFDSRFEFAVRSWALQSEKLLSIVQEADQMRLDALKQMFMRFGEKKFPADVRARTTYLVQIGYISMQSEEELSIRMKRIAEYVAIYTGHAPSKKELNQFYSRHGYKPG